VTKTEESITVQAIHREEQSELDAGRIIADTYSTDSLTSEEQLEGVPLLSEEKSQGSTEDSQTTNSSISEKKRTHRVAGFFSRIQSLIKNKNPHSIPPCLKEQSEIDEDAHIFISEAKAKPSRGTLKLIEDSSDISSIPVSVPPTQKENPQKALEVEIKKLKKELRLAGYNIEALEKQKIKQDREIIQLGQTISKLQLEPHLLREKNKALEKQLQHVIETHEKFVQIHGELSGGSTDQFLQMSAVLEETRAQLRRALGDVNLQSKKALQQQLKTQKEVFEQERAALDLQRVSEVRQMRLLLEQDKAGAVSVLEQLCQDQAHQVDDYKQQYEVIRQEKLEVFQQRDAQLEINKQLADELRSVVALNHTAEQRHQEVIVAIEKRQQVEIAALQEKLWSQEALRKAVVDSTILFKEESEQLFKKQMTKGLFILGAITAALGNIVTLIAAGISYWVQKRALKAKVRSMGVEDMPSDKTATDLEFVTFKPGSFFNFCASFGNIGYLPEYKMQIKGTCAPTLQ
jgi:hypothetical protein